MIDKGLTNNGFKHTLYNEIINQSSIIAQLSCLKLVIKDKNENLL